MIVESSGGLGRLILEHGRAVDAHDLRLDGECAKSMLFSHCFWSARR